jgi:hypothetical protein
MAKSPGYTMPPGSYGSTPSTSGTPRTLGVPGIAQTIRAPISQSSHDKLVAFVQDIVAQQGTWWKDRLEQADLLYYLMQPAIYDKDHIQARAEELGLKPDDMLEAPVIISQIETAVASLADTFLSGYPIFGVVTPPDQQEAGEQLETLIASYTQLGSWNTNLLGFFRAACKYTVAPFALTTRFGYDLLGEVNLGVPGTYQPRKVNSFVLPDLHMPDPYNVVFDYRVLPKDLALKGDYIGHAEMMPRTYLKQQLLAVQEAGPNYAGRLLNLDKWMDTATSYANYHIHPTVAKIGVQGVKDYWTSWFSSGNPQDRMTISGQFYTAGHALVRKLFVRIVPKEFGLDRYGGNTPMVFELWLVNDQVIVYFAPVFMYANSFPIGFADLQNDGFGYGAKTEVALFAPFQQAASTLLTSAVLTAERATGDRAIFDSNYLSAANLKKANGASYIPLTQSLLQDRSLQSVYHSIPYDASLAQMSPGLIREIVNTAQMLRGRNNFQQGLPQKGNRTLGEFQEVMGQSDVRQELPAMQMEAQAFTPVKQWLKQWIAMNATKEALVNHRTKAVVEISPQSIADMQYDFKLSTGYFSKQMLSSSDEVTNMMQVITGNPELMAKFDVPAMLSYIMSLRGFKDMEQFIVAPPPQGGMQGAEGIQAPPEAGAPSATPAAAPAAPAPTST